MTGEVRPLRIAVVTPYFPVQAQPYRGHSTYQTLRELRRFAAVEVYCPVATYPQPEWLRPRSYQYVPVNSEYSPPDLRAVYFAYPALPVVSRPLNGLVCAQRLLPYIRRSRPDLILNYWLYPEGYAAVAVGRALGIPAIAAAIGSDLRRIPDAITRRLTRTTLRRAAFVLTVSEELRRQALRLGATEERSCAILNGCDGSVFHRRDRLQARGELGVPENAEVVLFAGFLAPAKGVRELLEAVVLLSRAHPRVQLVAVGEGPLRAELETRARAAGVAGRVRFPGRCSSEEVARWMAAANVFCLPSHSEGCPNVIVEALSCGTPVVASNVGGIPELVSAEAGILVAPQDAAGLAAALDQALGRCWDAAAISRRSSRGWDQVAKETFAACLRALPAGGRQ